MKQTLDSEETFPHRRYNALTGEWLLVSPHRTLRPWQGQREQRHRRQAAPTQAGQHPVGDVESRDERHPGDAGKGMRRQLGRLHHYSTTERGRGRLHPAMARV